MQDKQKMKLPIIVLSIVVLLGLMVVIQKVWCLSRPTPVPVTDSALTEFYYSHSGSTMEYIYSYQVKSDESSPTGFTVIFNLNCGYDIYSTYADEELIQAINALIENQELHRWNGFNKNNYRVLDGSSFSLNIVYANGIQIYAHGNNSFPKGYSECAKQIDRLFNDYMEKNRNRLVEITDEWHS